MERHRRSLTGTLALAVSMVLAIPVQPTGAGASAMDTPARYIHPVVGLVIDRFDASAGRFGAGNRGLDYLVAPSQRVSAAGDGVVVFAGSVAGRRYVTILHPDGLRSSYSYLMTVAVVRGQAVTAGQRLGSTSMVFQIGFRRGEVYIDPAPLLTGPMSARLIAPS